MSSEEDPDPDDARITVESSSIEGIVDALGFEIVEPEEEAEEEPAEPSEYPEELLDVLETVGDIYEGVEIATENDSRGRSRKMVRQYADREDLTSNEVGYILRVLEIHDLIVQDGNRWRLAEADEE